MLFKKEIKEIPPCAFGKKLTKAESEKYQFLAVAKVEKTKRSGEILIVDYYATSDQKLQARFFADVATNNHIVYTPDNDKWTHGSIARLLDMTYHGSELSILDRKGVQKTVSNYLDLFENHFCHGYYYGFGNYIPEIKGATGTLETWLQKKREVENKKQAQRVSDREHLYHSLFTKYSFEKDIDRYFLERFNSNPYLYYIFYHKLDKKGNRYGVCSHCGKRIALPRTRPRKGETHQCPKCGAEGKFVDLRYAYKVADKQRVAIANRKDNYITFEVMDCERGFSEQGKPRLTYEEIYRTVYDTNKKTVMSSSAQHFYWHWTHYGKWAPGAHEIAMYPNNLNEIMRDVVPYLDMTQISKRNGTKINMIQLFLNCARYPCTEYLYKMGFQKLAGSERIRDYVNVKGKTATDVLGISKEQLRWATKADLVPGELEFIREVNYPMNAEQFDFVRFNKLVGHQERINELLQYMSLTKLFSYIKKQKLWHYSIRDTLISFSDYVRMSEEIGVHLNRKNIFPKQVFEAHDLVTLRLNEIRAAARKEALAQEAERIKQGLALVNERFKHYEKSGYCIILPHTREDFVREGQELSHCVGSQRYYENHIKGRYLIFFIREADKPDIAKYTAEIDMVNYYVVQCYGYGDSRPPKEVKDFIGGFAKYLKTHQNKEINYAEDFRTEKSA